MANFRASPRSGMTSKSADLRPTPSRLRRLAHVGLGLFVVALALYLVVAAWPTVRATSTQAACLVIAWAQVASLAVAAAGWATSQLVDRYEARTGGGRQRWGSGGHNKAPRYQIQPKLARGVLIRGAMLPLYGV